MKTNKTCAYNLKYILFLIILTQSCSQGKIEGLYGTRENNGLTSYKIEIKPDGTFEEFDWSHMSPVSSVKGKWFLDGDTLVLNTALQPKAKIEKQFNPNLGDSIQFQVIDLDGKHLEGATIYIDDQDLPFTTNQAGKYATIFNVQKRVEISFIGYESAFIELSTKDHNLFKVYLEDHIISWYKTDKKWLIEDARLYHVLDKNGEFAREVFLVKKNISEK